MSETPVTAAFLAALSQEVQPFLRRVRARRLRGREFPLWEFTWGASKGVAVVSGMGEDAAVRSAAWVLERYNPEVFIGIGFGGAVTPELPAGTLVLGQFFWKYEPEGQELQELTVPPLPPWLADLVERLQAAGMPAFLGSVVTTGGIIHKASHRAYLNHLPYPVLDLETSGWAVAAQERDLPFLALRAITDEAGEEIPDFLRKAAQQGKAPNLAEVLAWLVRDPRRLSPLYRLWRRSRLATRHLTKALEVVLEVL